MRIIYYGPEHLAACAHLLIEVYNTTTWDCRWSTEKAKTYIEELTQMPRFVGFLLEDDGEIVGVSLCHERTWWRHDELNINEFYISPDLQHRGYGTHLIRFMEKYVKERNLAGITLMTNNVDAAQFYHKNKFHYNDLVFMYKGIESKVKSDERLA